jgi:Skp family chaperone for outer membrane proteins
MRTFRTIGTWTMLLGLATWWLDMRHESARASADDAPSKTAAEFPLATLDLNTVYKKYNKFIESSAAMKEEVQAATEKAKARSREVAELQAKLILTTPNTDEFRHIEAEVKELSASLKQDLENQAKAFQIQEAAIMYEAYQRISSVVTSYCEQHGIKMVLRTNTHVINPMEPKTVLTLINQPIVYRDNLDITDAIVAALNEAEPAKSE